MRKQRKKTPLSIEDVEAVAATMDYLAKRYRAVAESMRESGLSQVEVGSFDTLDRARYYLQGASAAIQKAMDNAMIPASVWQSKATPATAKPDFQSEILKDRKKSKKAKG